VLLCDVHKLLGQEMNRKILDSCLEYLKCLPSFAVTIKAGDSTGLLVQVDPYWPISTFSAFG